MVLSGRDVERVCRLRPLDDFSEYPHGHNPRLAADSVAKSFYQSLFALVLSALRFGNMSRGAADGHLELSSLDNFARVISRGGFQTVDLLDALVNPDGSQIDRGDRSSPDFSLKEELLSGRVKVLTKTDFPEWNNKEAAKNTSYSIILSRGNWSVTTEIWSLRIQSKTGV